MPPSLQKSHSNMRMPWKEAHYSMHFHLTGRMPRHTSHVHCAVLHNKHAMHLRRSKYCKQASQTACQATGQTHAAPPGRKPAPAQPTIGTALPASALEQFRAELYQGSRDAAGGHAEVGIHG